MISKILNIYKNNFIVIFIPTFIYSIFSVSFMHLLTPYMAKTDIMSAFTVSFKEVGLIMILNELLRVLYLTFFIKIILELLNNNKVSLNTIFSFSLFKKFLLLDLFILVIVIAGMMMLIVPGVIWYILAIFSYFVVAKDDNTKILEAISNSISLSKGFRLKIFVILFIYLIFSLLGYIGYVIAVLIDVIILPLVYFYIGILFNEANKLKEI